MNAEAFLSENERSEAPQFREWLSGLLKGFLGAVLLWVVVRALSPQLPLLRGWVGMVGMILLLHFGAFHLLAMFWQSLGIPAQPIMLNPLRSRSLSEFWGRRWNLGFHDAAQHLIFRPLRQIMPVSFAALTVFAVSGLVHDFVISVPSRAGFGLPTAYFVLQASGLLVERSSFGRNVGLGRGLCGRLFLLLIAGAPAFWLFHPAFVSRVILPFMEEIRAI